MVQATHGLLGMAGGVGKDDTILLYKSTRTASRSSTTPGCCPWHLRPAFSETYGRMSHDGSGGSISSPTPASRTTPPAAAPTPPPTLSAPVDAASAASTTAADEGLVWAIVIIIVAVILVPVAVLGTVSSRRGGKATAPAAKAKATEPATATKATPGETAARVA